MSPDFEPISELGKAYKSGGQREFDRNTLQGVRKSVTVCHDVNQRIIRAFDARMEADRQHQNRQLRNDVIVLVISPLLGAALAHAPKVWAMLETLLR